MKRVNSGSQWKLPRQQWISERKGNAYARDREVRSGLMTVEWVIGSRNPSATPLRIRSNCSKLAEEAMIPNGIGQTSAGCGEEQNDAHFCGTDRSHTLKSCVQSEDAAMWRMRRKIWVCWDLRSNFNRGREQYALFTIRGRNEWEMR